jgi:hypothetical protein
MIRPREPVRRREGSCAVLPVYSRKPTSRRIAHLCILVPPVAILRFPELTRRSMRARMRSSSSAVLGLAFRSSSLVVGRIVVSTTYRRLWRTLRLQRRKVTRVERRKHWLSNTSPIHRMRRARLWRWDRAEERRVPTRVRGALRTAHRIHGMHDMLVWHASRGSGTLLPCKAAELAPGLLRRRLLPVRALTSQRLVGRGWRGRTAAVAVVETVFHVLL